MHIEVAPFQNDNAVIIVMSEKEAIKEFVSIQNRLRNINFRYDRTYLENYKQKLDRALYLIEKKKEDKSYEI
jgi:urocanate hydratase